MILVLGEAVGSAARGVRRVLGADFHQVGVVGFMVVAGIWWIYFDITAPSSAESCRMLRRGGRGVELGRGGD